MTHFPLPETAVSSKDRLQGIFYMVLAAIFWAVLELTGLYIPAQHSAYQTVYVRYGTHLIFMFAVVAPIYGVKPIVKTNLLRLQIIRPFLMIGMPVFYIIGLEYMSLKNVWSVFWVAPIMVMVLAVWLLKERVAMPRWVAITIGFVGMLLILQPDSEMFSWTAVFPIVMAFCFALYRIFTRMLSKENTWANLFYTAFVVFIPWTIGLPRFWVTPTLRGLLPMVAIGLFGFATLYCLDKAYERAPASILAPFTYAQPVVIIGVRLLFGNIPNFNALAGAVLIAGMALYLIRYETKTPLPTPALEVGN